MKKSYIAAIVLAVIVVVALGGYLAYDHGLFGQAAGVVAQTVPTGSDEVPVNQL